jgi:PEP-CTERM motif
VKYLLLLCLILLPVTAHCDMMDYTFAGFVNSISPLGSPPPGITHWDDYIGTNVSITFELDLDAWKSIPVGTGETMEVKIVRISSNFFLNLVPTGSVGSYSALAYAAGDPPLWYDYPIRSQNSINYIGFGTDEGNHRNNTLNWYIGMEVDAIGATTFGSPMYSLFLTSIDSPSSVPEPSAILIFGLGILLVLGLKSRSA